MALTSRSKLGPYEIVAPLGSGGMGEVYRARDTRLEREVAIKVLPATLSTDPSLRQRLEREAKAISKLSHPHICTLHDIGQQDGVDFLVLELLEGETLEQRLTKGPLPPEQTLRYAAQIADALAKAHKLGITHRDLKPANVMLTKDGAKLMDFGLAKHSGRALEAAALDEMTMEEARLTGEGTIVGTFQYMAPEQLEGKEADARTDIFALGEVIYEMATGKPAFSGKSRASLIAAILTTEPQPITQLQPLAPTALERVVKKCLAKDSDDRWQSAADLASELKWIGEGMSQTSVSVAPATKRIRHWFIWAVTATVATLALAGFLAFQIFTTRTAPVVVSDIVLPKGTQFSVLFNGPPALSPDGRALVFSAFDASGKTFLWLRQLDGSPALPIPGTEDAHSPFWSPDSLRIGFFVHQKLIIFELPAGPAVTLAEGVTGPGGGSWSRAGTMLFPGDRGIFQVSVSGGPAALVLPRDGSIYAFLLRPVFLHDGRHFLYQAANPSSSDVFFASVDGKQNRLLLQGTSQAIYASGLLLYVRAATLLAQPFDPETGQLTGTQRPIAVQVQEAAFGALFAASQNGALIYAPATGAPNQTQLASLDRSGKRLALIGVPDIHYDVRLSPDARRLASSAGGPKSEIWVDDLDRNVRMRLTFDPDTDNGIPVWSPDGRTLLFSTLRGSKAGVGIFRKASNGAGGEELLLPSDRPDREVWATDWSRDGRFLLLSKGDMANNLEADIWVLPTLGEKKPILFLRAPAATFEATFSPDGRWVAYTSRESGRAEVYVVAFDPSKSPSDSGTSNAVGGKWQISSNGGTTPRWRRDGKELFYIGSGNTIMAVQTEGKGGSFGVGRSQRLFTAPANPFASTYDVTPDGQRFIMSVATSEQEEARLILMSNWPARLQGK